MKGVSNALLALVLLIIALVGFGALWLGYLSLTYRPAVAVEYKGEFSDAFLATEGSFSNSFTEQTDCNITNDVLGYNWESCVYRSINELNATKNAFMNDHDLYFPIVFDIDGDVGPDSYISIDTGGGTQSTGVPEDDVLLVDAKIYTHEDESPSSSTLIADLKPFIEDHEDINKVKLSELGLSSLAGDEYVLYVKWHTLTISPAFTTGDDIARITFSLDTTEDVDTAQITVESK